MVASSLYSTVFVYTMCTMLMLVNPRRACTARVTVVGSWVCLCVCPFVCYHAFCDYAQRDNETAIPTGSSLHWLHIHKGDFRITTAFRSYGVKSKWTSQYWNLYKVTLTGSACSVCLGGARSLEAQEVTTKEVYRLLHAIYYCSQTLHDLPAGNHE